MLSFLAAQPGKDPGARERHQSGDRDDLRATAPRAELVCVDLSGEMLDVARSKRQLEGATFIQGDFRKAWPAERFDVVISSLCVHHIAPEERSSVARRAAGCLVPGGASSAGRSSVHSTDGRRRCCEPGGSRI